MSIYELVVAVLTQLSGLLAGNVVSMSAGLAIGTPPMVVVLINEILVVAKIVFYLLILQNVSRAPFIGGMAERLIERAHDRIKDHKPAPWVLMFISILPYSNEAAAFLIYKSTSFRRLQYFIAILLGEIARGLLTITLGSALMKAFGIRALIAVMAVIIVLVLSLRVRDLFVE